MHFAIVNLIKIGNHIGTGTGIDHTAISRSSGGALRLLSHGNLKKKVPVPYRTDIKLTPLVEESHYKLQ
jgi:hypothetical protein